MKKLLAVFAALALATGVAYAQDKKDAKKDEKKAEKMEKKADKADKADKKKADEKKK